LLAHDGGECVFVFSGKESVSDSLNKMEQIFWASATSTNTMSGAAFSSYQVRKQADVPEVLR
jgi:hypothetical protein